MKKWLIVAACLMAAGLIIGTVCLAISGFDFAKLGTQNMVTNTYTTEETFTNIHLDAITADITFVPSEDGEVKVVCYEDEKISYSVYVEEDSLVITCKDNRKWHDYISFNWKSTTVTVYLPAGEYGDLKLSCTTGNVTMPADFHFAKASVNVTTGDVLWKAHTDDTLSIHGSTGHVTTEGVLCGKLEIKTTTGDIKLMQTQAADTLTVKVNTGDVKLDRVDAPNITIKATTGDVTGTLLSNKLFITDVSTGDVRVPESIDGGKCKVTTTTGNIHLEIAE